MRRFKVFTDFEKEEKYLNDMAREGKILQKYSCLGFYHFKESSPQDLKYRIDYRVFKRNEDFEDYKALFEDAGWQHVYGTRWSCNQYYLPTQKSADDRIFSSEESAAARYKLFYEMCSANVSIAVCYFVVVLITADFNLGNITFLTPGLWEMTGTHFWRAFLVELPFVFFRTIPPFLLLIYGFIYAVWAGKSRKLYKQRVQENKDKV